MGALSQCSLLLLFKWCERDTQNCIQGWEFSCSYFSSALPPTLEFQPSSRHRQRLEGFLQHSSTSGTWTRQLMRSAKPERVHKHAVYKILRQQKGIVETGMPWYILENAGRVGLLVSTLMTGPTVLVLLHVSTICHLPQITWFENQAFLHNRNMFYSAH